ncbi:hypothetical protein BX600DRAFT_462329 [Xylariales sp. PMI_506]|nr:hypothetical protein BX600DRAFT_462329 [Xylariales sp. PMI_506]
MLQQIFLTLLIGWGVRCCNFFVRPWLQRLSAGQGALLDRARLVDSLGRLERSNWMLLQWSCTPPRSTWRAARLSQETNDF